jgi:DNA gyrase subunit A
LRHVQARPEERTAYLRLAAAARRAVTGEPPADEATTAMDAEVEEAAPSIELGQDKYAEMGAAEQFVLTVSSNGFGKRSSSFEYRITGRGGKGIVAMVTNERNGELVASFPVEHADQIMLITNGGQTIRVPVDGIRIAGRSTQGVTVFHTAKGEHVVSVEHIEGDEETEGDGGAENGEG